MQYSINILKANIKEHEEKIFALQNQEPELDSDIFFCDAEIKERKSYIEELQLAILTLHKYDIKR